MKTKKISYEEARPMMKAGDVIAFGGKGHFSEIIKLATRSAVSHVGVILQTRVKNDDTDRFFNQIIESTSLHGFNGVTISRFSDRLHDYDGEIWWLPISHGIWRQNFDPKAFYDFLLNQARDRKPYDVPQAIGSALDVLDRLPFDGHGPGYNKEDFSRFFCSELVAAGLEVANVVPSVNSSEVTPIDLCRWSIFESDYYLLKGDASKQISRYNTRNPSDWNV
jgi:hypothetical protein